MKKVFYTLFIIATIFASCNNKKVYDKYNHTPLAGWEKNDTLSFDVPRLAHAGSYSSQLGLRINGVYPFMGLTLIVEQQILPSRKIVVDTIQCELIDKNGTTNGQGINYYQYNYHITHLFLNKGDSLHIAIRHDMKREILPGISDIGYQLTSN